jgi:hypothetical protein
MEIKIRRKIGTIDEMKAALSTVSAHKRLLFSMKQAEMSH